MVTIKWCLGKPSGIEIIGPNSNLATAYVEKATNALATLRQVSDRDWKISTSYYTMYYSLYAILMKIGIKCEIHQCTLEFMRQFLTGLITEEDTKLINDAFKSRNDSQYYVNRKVPDEVYSRITVKATGFMLKCKTILNTITDKQTQEIRHALKMEIKKNS